MTGGIGLRIHPALLHVVKVYVIANEAVKGQTRSGFLEKRLIYNHV